MSEPAAFRATAMVIRSTILREVAMVLDRAGLGEVAWMHGSYVRGQETYVVCRGATFGVSDLDVFVRGSVNDRQCEQLSAECTERLRASTSVIWTPASKVSVQPEHILRTTPEYSGIMRSALKAGVLARDAATTLPDTHALRQVPLDYGFALPYACIRWLSWAGRGQAGDMAALYELTKACGRASGADEWIRDKPLLAKSTALTAELKVRVKTLEGSPYESFVSPVQQWLADHGEADMYLGRETRFRLARTLLALLLGPLGSSRLLDRLESVKINDAGIEARSGYTH